jgi:hypothetical protein
MFRCLEGTKYLQGRFPLSLNLILVRVSMIIVLGLNHNAEFREVESLTLVSVEFKKSSYDLVYELLQLFLSDIRISECLRCCLAAASTYSTEMT